MADYGFDEMIKVSLLPSVANPDAVTLAELAAGVPLEGVLTADGLSITPETATINTSRLNSSGNSEIIGRDSWTVSVSYVNGSDPEQVAAREVLIRGASGVLAVRADKISAVDWAASDNVELYPIQCKRPSRSAPAPDTLQVVTVGMALTDATKVRSVDNPSVVAA